MSDVVINTLVQYEREGKETYYLLFRKEKGISLRTIRNEIATINACQCYFFEVELVATVVFFAFLHCKSNHITKHAVVMK